VASASVRRYLPVLGVGVGLVVYPFLVKDPFWQNLAVLVLINATAAAAWNLLGGFAGQISFGHSIFFGVGAYSTGFLLLRFGWSPWLGLLVGAVVAIGIGLVIGFPVFRLRSHYFSIATIALQQVLFIVVVNSKALGQATGLELPIRPQSLAQLQFSTRDLTTYHLLALVLFGLASGAVWLYMRGRLGAYLKALRDDEEVARAIGIAVRRHKLYAISLSAALTALAGGYYAMYSLFVDPNVVLSLTQSIAIVLVAVLGGAGSLWGPLIGAWVLGIIQQETRVTLSSAGNSLDFVIYGLLVVAIAVFQPAGLVGTAGKVRRWLGQLAR